MSRLLATLVRHGDCHQLADTPPFALNAEGEGQARKSAQAISSLLEQHDWSLLSVFNTSRMRRTWQTARIVAGELEQEAKSNITLSSFDELAERCVGSAANLTRKQIEEVVQQGDQ